LPATTVVLSEESIAEQRSRAGNTSSANNIMLLKNFKAAADELRLSGVIYIALSEDVFFRASRVVPLQVLPAFERKRDDLLLLSSTGGGDVDSSSSSVAASVSTTAAGLASANAAKEGEEAAASATAAAAASAAASADPKSFVLTWPPTAPSPATRLLATITQLVTQGYSPLVVDAASVPLQNYDMVLYGFPKDAVYFADTSPGIGDEVRRPFSSETSDDSKTLTVETMYAPSSAFTANFMQAWAVKKLERQHGQERAAASAAAAAAAGAALAAEDTKLLSIADLKALAACRLETMSGFTPCPWRGVSVETLPVHWFAPQSAFFGSGWTRRARKHALLLEMSSGGGGGAVNGGGPSSVASRSSSWSLSKTIFRLRQAGKWHAPARCQTYSALSRVPRDLTHETVFDELALHAKFLSFVRERKIACAVLPGFRVPLTGATLSVDALLDLETLQASAGTQATILPRVQDVEEASQGYVAFDRDHHRKSEHTRSSSSQHSRKQKDLSEEDLCSVFHHFAPSPSPTACLAKGISRALNKARSALPTSSFACALDARRTVEEVALTGLRGASGIAEVAAKVSKATAALKASSSPPPPPDAVTVLLTGAWRLLPRGSFIKSASYSSSHSPSQVVTISDLHSHDQKLQCAQELNPKPSPLADEAWAGVLEALLCRHSVLSVDVSGQLSASLLDAGKKSARSKAAAAGHRRKTTKKNFAELVARHIPPSILLEDVTAFAKWLARPDRPHLVRGRSLQFLFAGEGGGGADRDGGGGKEPSSGSSSISSASAAASASKTPSSSLRHKAALQSLSMLAHTIAETRADYAFLPAAADATTGNLLPWSSITEIGELYRVRPTLLPPSLAAMMHPEAVLEFLLSPESSTLPLNIVAVEEGGARQEGDIANTLNHLFQDAAFRTTVAALGRAKRSEAALLKSMTKKKLWALPPAAAAGHQQSREATLPVSSMGASDDVVVRLFSGTG